MKKIIDVKEIMIILISVVLITVSTVAFATEEIFGLGNNTQSVTGDEYKNAQRPDVENVPGNNTPGNNTPGNNVPGNNNTGNNTVKTYNTNNTNKTDLPQTGIEDYNIGIVLIICVASAIYAYKKVGDYRNI